jgi:hypothetical protein
MPATRKQQPGAAKDIALFGLVAGALPGLVLPRRLLCCLAIMVAALAVAAEASASTIVARNATGVQLAVVDARGTAVVSFREGGVTRHLLASGATNADAKFKLDYAGVRRASKSIKGCPLYDGPPLAWLTVACKAPDGSYWAVQTWQRLLPNQGYAPFVPAQAVWESHLSHWTGPLPELTVYLDWIDGGKYAHLFGRYTYLGKPVHGFVSTSAGIPLDPYGRNIYLDTRDSAYGKGWRRENAFLPHRPNGNFCYGFIARRSYYDRTTRPAGAGSNYRATAIGPGVAPDVFWTGAAPTAFDVAYEARMNRLSDQIAGGDPSCGQH